MSCFPTASKRPRWRPRENSRGGWREVLVQGKRVVSGWVAAFLIAGETEPSGETEKIRESAKRGLRLPISTWETKDGVVYELDVPGVSEKEFDVYIEAVEPTAKRAAATGTTKAFFIIFYPCLLLETKTQRYKYPDIGGDCYR